MVLGALVLAYQGIPYTRHQRILDIGPFHATQDTREHFPLSPILAGLALVAGTALLLVRAQAKV